MNPAATQPMDPAATRRGPAGSWLCWLFLAALVAYAGLIHHGLGPAPPGGGGGWYTPTGFLYGWKFLGASLESTGTTLAVVALPACALVVAVFVSGRSAIARALALSALVATLLFAFYGVQASFVWLFFKWRGSLVMIATALWVGCAAASPFLAASWLRRGWGLRVCLYLPVFLAALALMRNATGTDPDLPFMISPWPAIPVFGIEVGVLFVATLLAGIALGVTGAARARRATDGSPLSGLALLAVGVAAPGLLLAVGSRLGMLAFGVGLRTVAAVTLLAIAGIGLAARLGARGPGVLARRARHFGVATALVGLPLIAGQALAYRDYVVTREVRAQAIIDALEAFYGREEMYPDALEELVAAGDLEEIPAPRIGFGIFYDEEFAYDSFGTSYVLEFIATRWVQCAYNPPWVDEEEEEAGIDGAGLAEAWSCPSQPPELW